MLQSDPLTQALHVQSSSVLDVDLNTVSVDNLGVKPIKKRIKGRKGMGTNPILYIYEAAALLAS